MSHRRPRTRPARRRRHTPARQPGRSGPRGDDENPVNADERPSGPARESPLVPWLTSPAEALSASSAGRADRAFEVGLTEFVKHAREVRAGTCRQ
ncbi:hypothetical protein ABZ192_11840 [Streptomyces sp. NPDC006235]|uniref:hypothetical protein n=1 Tax=Streptomyces sp. NPDC006235 TaxID=3156736 RepID=UPI0033AF9D3A